MRGRKDRVSCTALEQCRLYADIAALVRLDSPAAPVRILVRPAKEHKRRNNNSGGPDGPEQEREFEVRLLSPTEQEYKPERRQ